jgi:hypothetical protein
MPVAGKRQESSLGGLGAVLDVHTQLKYRTLLMTVDVICTVLFSFSSIVFQ